jgi:hypothetical protein
MAKGSALSRALAFFRDEPDIDVVNVAYEIVTKITRRRLEALDRPSKSRQPRQHKVDGSAVAVKEHESLGNA